MIPDPIPDPWIILLVDRARLGFAVLALAPPRKGDRGGKIRRTLMAEHARRFSTRRRAARVAARLGASAAGVKLHFVPIELTEGDFSRHAREPRATPGALFGDEAEP